MDTHACCGGKNATKKQIGLLALRIAIGGILVYHGYGKLFGAAPSGGMEAFTATVAGLGFPLPVLFAYAAALSEFVGGIAFLLGIGIRIFSVLNGFVMLVALFGVHRFSFPKSDLPLALLAITVALYCLGAGRYALMRRSSHGCRCQHSSEKNLPSSAS